MPTPDLDLESRKEDFQIERKIPVKKDEQPIQVSKNLCLALPIDVIQAVQTSLLTEHSISLLNKSIDSLS